MSNQVEFLQAETKDALPTIVPAGWHYNLEYFNCLDNLGRRLRVIISVERVVGQKWLHVSLSNSERLPNWNELRDAKDLFIGKQRKAILILPPEGEYVNDNPYVLHLWCCLDGDPLPDFRRHGGTL